MPEIKRVLLHKCESCEKQAASALIALEGIAFSVCEDCLPNEP